MSSFARPIVFPIKNRRSDALTASMGAALLSAAILLGPAGPAWAQSGAAASATHTQNATRAETVDQRIATLHAALKITPAEETDWQAVAQTMRDNAAAMQKLVADKASQASESMTAIDDLQTYARFAQAHVDGLKSLTAAFQTLYTSMPDDQKKIADRVFQNSRRQEASASR